MKALLLGKMPSLDFIASRIRSTIISRFNRVSGGRTFQRNCDPIVWQIHASNSSQEPPKCLSFVRFSSLSPPHQASGMTSNLCYLHFKVFIHALVPEPTENAFYHPGCYRRAAMTNAAFQAGLPCPCIISSLSNKLASNTAEKASKLPSSCLRKTDRQRGTLDTSVSWAGSQLIAPAFIQGTYPSLGVRSYTARERKKNCPEKSSNTRGSKN